MPIDFSKYQKEPVVEKSEKSVEIKNIPTKKKPKKPKEPLDILFKDMTITQDDLWFLYRLKVGTGTRVSKKRLLPKFTEVFNKNLKKLKGD